MCVSGWKMVHIFCQLEEMNVYFRFDRNDLESVYMSYSKQKVTLLE